MFPTNKATVSLPCPYGNYRPTYKFGCKGTLFLLTGKNKFELIFRGNLLIHNVYKNILFTTTILVLGDDISRLYAGLVLIMLFLKKVTDITE